MRPNWRKLTAVLLPLVVTASVVYGCSSSRPEAAGDGTGNVALDPDAKCSTEGQTRPCYELISIHAGVRSCFQGTQTCQAGLWSTCGGSGTIAATNVGIGVSNLADPTPAEIHTLTHPGSGLPDAGACANKCNPDCVGYDEDAGLTLEASIPPLGTGSPATPPGFVDKLIRSKGSSYGKDCERWDTGNSETGWVHSACQTDYYCSRHSSGTDGYCVQFGEGPGETHAGKLAGTTNGGVECADVFPDLTLATPCLLGTEIVVPICNRGSGTIATGTTIKVSEENATEVTPTAPTMKLTPAPATPMLDCPTFSSNICSVTLAAPLVPGSCVRFSSAACAGVLNGNKSLYVNADKAVRECIIQPKVLGPPVSAHGPTVEQPRQYGCANNWTAFNASQVPACIVAYTPQVFVIPYNPSCGAGQRVQWGQLAWNSSIPGTSEILFEVRVRERLPDGGVGAWGAWVTVGDAKQLPTAIDPAICPMLGPTPCPKDVFVPLGGIPAARYEDLELRITLNPGLLGAVAVAPVLNSYQLAYSCVAAE